MKAIDAAEYIAVFDRKDYDIRWPRITRVAARAIINIDGYYVLIQSSKYGEYKFPGGGQEDNEDIIDTLIREVLEETGLTVIPESIVPFGKTLELNRDDYERDSEAIFEMMSYYYECSVKDNGDKISLTDSEKKLGYSLKYVLLEDAIENNRAIKYHNNIPWLKRDTTVMEYLCNNVKKLLN